MNGPWNGPSITTAPCSSAAALQAVADTPFSTAKNQVGRHIYGLGHRWGSNRKVHSLCRFFAVIDEDYVGSVNCTNPGCSSCRKQILADRKTRKRKIEREMKAFTNAQSTLWE
jgi:hypothetical protein